MWGPYGTYGQVVQQWTDTNSAAWGNFDSQVAQFGEPTAVWVQICIFEWQGATFQEVQQLIANAREHAAPGATIYISGQPVYSGGHVCSAAGTTGPEDMEALAAQAAADPALDVIHVGPFGPLSSSQVQADGCHANDQGKQALGMQALDFFG